MKPPLPDPAQHVVRRGPLLAIILTSYLMIVLDISIVITALPKIRESLGFTVTGLSWVQNAYTLTFGGLLLLGARAGDILGRRAMFIAGLALFTLASMVIGLAASPAWLVGARAVQGVGAAILAPSTLALLSTNFAEGPERTRALGFYGATAGISASVGLVLGGILADLVSWRVGFFLNLPIGLALIWAARKYIVETPRSSGELDLVGAVCSTLGMGALVYGLVHAASAGWGDVWTVGPLVVGIAALALFVFNESRARQPILPLHLFASRERTGALAGRLLFLGGMVGFWFYTTQFLQEVLGMRPLQAGLAFLPTTVVNFAVALAVPRLSQRFGNARLLAVGLLVSVIGMVWLGQVTADTVYLTGVALPMLLVGAGQGAALSPLTIAGVAGVAAEDAGAASGLVNVAHQLGGSLGLAVLVVVFAAAGPGNTDTHTRVDLAHRIATAMSAGAVLLGLALAVVLFCIVRRSPPIPLPVKPA
ncbi:drug resistance transporter, EmrB/QacA subfamily [Rhodoferax sp. OV413]|uniref:MFS transporter n=1 Tax=Rhodoferax sp. OV413 TaxID=1855285 RepID=UPI0008865325|nr:MFS transporter [Rhodoferax sp. OV413]SDO89644.1 drug resistance transporter, EmrB/QacA subfamily [Rhodoferax sp. OV413]